MFGYEQTTTGRGCGPGHHGGHRRYRHWRGEFPFGPGFGPGPGPRGGWRKARRGDIRTAALLLLAEEPRNGYEIMQLVEERSDGVWRPSPGSVYPALAQLEDEGLIRSQELDGRKVFAITDEGRALLAQRGEDQPAPWVQMSSGLGDEQIQIGKLIREIAFAFAQLARTGSPAQVTAAREVLAQTRRDLYRILGEGDEGTASAGGTVDVEA